jgi:two-component system cell cycle response regulator
MSQDTATVFIADDNPAIRHGLERALTANGYAVSTASDGRAVLALLADAATAPDLLLLDVMMPEMSGLEVLRTLRRDPGLSEVPVVLITATHDGALPVSALRDGAVDFLTKPFRLDELLARVESHIRRHRELRQAREQARIRLQAIDLIRELNHVATASEMFHLVTTRTSEILGVARCSIVVLDERDGIARVAASSEPGTAEEVILDLEDYPELRAALASGGPVAVSDVAGSELFAEVRGAWEHRGMAAPLRSVVVVPFRISPEMTGFFVERAGAGEAPLGSHAAELAERVVEAVVQACGRVQVFQRLVEQRRRLEDIASTDALTGCATRRALFERLEAELEPARARTEWLSVVVLDVDHFKAINDTFGHLAGDAVLRALGRWLCSEESLNPPERAGRFGGDEFVVVLPGYDPGEALRFAERARTFFSSIPFVFGGRPVRATLSAGVASWPGVPAATAEELISAADAALYLAKQEGRDRVHAAGALPAVVEVSGAPA